MADGMKSRVQGAVTVSEFRARLAEIIGRVERGEQVLISRAGTPVARLVPATLPPRRRPGILKTMIGAEELEALSAAVDAPLSPREQAAIEGGTTDLLGIHRE